MVDEDHLLHPPLVYSTGPVGSTVLEARRVPGSHSSSAVSLQYPITPQVSPSPGQNQKPRPTIGGKCEQVASRAQAQAILDTLRLLLLVTLQTPYPGMLAHHQDASRRGARTSLGERPSDSSA